MITSGDDLLDALFRGGGVLSRLEIAFGLIAARAVIRYILKQKHALRARAGLTGHHPHRRRQPPPSQSALSAGVRAHDRPGLRYLGVLLMGSLIIIPAATTTERLVNSLSQMLTLSVAIALATTVAGVWLAVSLHRETRSVIVTLATACFLFTFLRRR
jgi:hypothetical protein